MDRLYKCLCLFLMFFVALSCGNREVTRGEIVYDGEHQIVLYEGKPYTGKVVGEGIDDDTYATVEDGKVLDIVETEEKANGYKEIRHKDGSSEYYDYNGVRISKKEYEDNK